MSRAKLIISAFGGAALVALAIGAAGLGSMRHAIATDSSAPVFRGELGEFSRFAAPRPVPPISFEDGDGRTLSLADFKGKVVLVNFWATWCAPCVREMPSLDRVEARLGGPDFAVLDLSLDRGGKGAVESYFAENKLGHLKIYLDGARGAFQAWHGEALPTSFIIGRDGLARGVILGPADWDSDDAIRLIRFYQQEGRKLPGASDVTRANGSQAAPAG